MLKKNELVTLEITDVTNEGNGVGRTEGITVFVPFTAVGDVIICRIVKAKKSYCYGITEKLLISSKSRCESGCEAYGKCGGCSLRHIEYSAELEIKEKIVRDAFERIGGLSPDFEPIIGASRVKKYRNKSQFPVGTDSSGRVIAGYYAKRSHRVIPIESCPQLPDIFLSICADITAFANENGIKAYDEQTGKGLLRHIFIRRGEYSGEIMAAVVVTSLNCKEKFKPLAGELSKKYSELKSFILNENDSGRNVILGQKSEALYGSETIKDKMCGRELSISLNSFYQINTLQAEKLYAKAQEYAALTGSEALLDLYCGAGTIGLSMADKVKKLIGVEIVSDAVKNAKENAELNLISNAEFICSDAGEAAKLLYSRSEKPDVIIADPARKGCTPDTLKYMAQMNPERIVMISCNPATAARDCAALEKLGYITQRVQAVDMFPRACHVECVALCQGQK
ncbi:MAG: 23S rRNA (uracil(1939)-C(5))-methyltransferase RlmD [Ruminococcus sp.]|nr:23S rRNA (uracil(1939)-C(5))-methyltransferase RlmD [Ruminococcus sp.]